MSIRTILIDDEPLATKELSVMLQKFPDIEIVDTASNSKEAIEKIQSLHPELIFLDINLPGKSGFELLEELDDAPYVIFVTAYDQFAIKAFEVNALDYILKPVNNDRLSEAIEKIKNQIQNKKTLEKQKLSIDKKIFIKDGEQCHFVPLSGITHIESVGNYSKIFYSTKKPLLHKSLNYLEEKLPGDYFFRANRQIIINVNYISNIVPYFNNSLQVELQNGIKVEISQRQSVKFKDLMGI